VAGGGEVSRFPTFFVIGVAKSGSTSLHHYLSQHPDVFMCTPKEPRTFAYLADPRDFAGPGDERVWGRAVTSLDAYRALFAEADGVPAVGEASVIYLPHAGTAETIARYVPDAKIITLLRDPADRARSAFLYQRRDGHEPCPTFEEAVAAEPARIAAGWNYRWHYRDQGFYHRNLEPYYEHFDASRIRVYLTEDLAGDPQAVLTDAFCFLGVDDAFRADIRRRLNISGIPRSRRAQRLLTQPHPAKEAIKKVVPEEWGHRLIARVLPANLERPAMRPETRAELVAGYEDDTARLERLIGRDLSHWRG
jgi:hypothetical protein